MALAPTFGPCENCDYEDDLSSNGLCEECEREAEEDAMRWRDEDLIDGVGFADPGGQSALRAATEDNPRNLPCPNCNEPDRLTPLDRARGYQCDTCAKQAERGW